MMRRLPLFCFRPCRKLRYKLFNAILPPANVCLCGQVTSAELPMGVSLAVAGIRTAVSATRQSQINAGVRYRRKGEKHLNLRKEMPWVQLSMKAAAGTWGKYKRERERGMVMKEKEERRKKYMC